MSEQIIWNILNQNLFFFKNAVKRLEAKTSEKLDIAVPSTREIVLECREPDLSGMVKMGRFFGGGHDYGTPFDIVAKHPASGQQAFRIERGSTSLTLGGVKIEFRNHRDELIGRMKKKTFAFGLKYAFSGAGDTGSYLFHLKRRGFLGEWQLCIGNQAIVRLVSDWREDSADYFKSENFECAFAVSAEVPLNQPIRQILLAFCTAIHRINA